MKPSNRRPAEVMATARTPMTRALLTLLALLTLASTAGAGVPDTVRVAASGAGTRYHVARCAALAGGSTLVYRASADSLGYVPCKRCFNPRPARVKRVPREVSR